MKQPQAAPQGASVKDGASRRCWPVLALCTVTLVVTSAVSGCGLSGQRAGPLPGPKRWRPLGTLAVPRDGAAAAVLEGRLYVLGGYNAGGYSRSVEVFDGSNWAPAPAMGQNRGHSHAAAVLGPRIYVMGGYTFTGGYLRSVEAFDGTTWTAAAPMVYFREGLAVANFRGALYAIGGYNNAGFLKEVESFNGETWQAAPTLTMARAGHAAAVFEDRLFAIGGYNIMFQFIREVEVFDGATWSLHGLLSVGRGFGVMAAALRQELVVVGGARADDPVVEAFDGLGWQQVPVSGQLARSFPALAVFNETVCAIGGYHLHTRDEDNATGSDRGAFASSVVCLVENNTTSTERTTAAEVAV